MTNRSCSEAVACAIKNGYTLGKNLHAAFIGTNCEITRTICLVFEEFGGPALVITSALQLRDARAKFGAFAPNLTIGRIGVKADIILATVEEAKDLTNFIELYNYDFKLIFFDDTHKMSREDFDLWTDFFHALGFTHKTSNALSLYFVVTPFKNMLEMASMNFRLE